MGWLRKRLGERTTAYGGALLYAAALQAFPAYAVITHAVAGALGVGLMVSPQQ